MAGRSATSRRLEDFLLFGSSLLVDRSILLRGPIFEPGDQFLAQLGIGLEEGQRLLPTLAKPLPVIGEPGAALLHQGPLDGGVEHAAPVRDALAIEDVEL